MRKPLQVYLDDQDRKLLEQIAERERLSLADTLRAAIRRWAVDALTIDDPIVRLIGTIDDDNVPPDLSTRNDEYAVAQSSADQTKSRKRP